MKLPTALIRAKPWFLGSDDQVLWDLWRFKLTTGGKALVASGVLAAVFGYPLQLPIMYVLAALFALGFISLCVNRLFPPRIEVSGSFPDRVTAGEPVTGWFTLVNRSRRTAYDVSVGFFGLERALERVNNPPLVSLIEAGGRARIPVTLRPLRRGAFVLPALWAYSEFPFHVCRSGQKTTLRNSLLAIPSFHALGQVDVPVGRRYQPGGIVLTSEVGESLEYIGNREYRPGDAPNRIDFRSWARLAKPVVREYQEEFYCRIALVLDTYVGRRRRPAAGFPDLEAAVSLVASVADALSHGEHIIDLFAAGPELYVFRAGRHIAHIENILDILACVEECRKDPFAVITPALVDELAGISTVVCVFLDWDPAREDIVQTALEAGCRVRVLVVRGGETTKPLEEAEALTGLPATQLTPAEVRAGGLERL